MTNIDVAIGAVIHARRLERNLSAEELASRLSIAADYVVMAERGLVRFSPHALQQVAQCLDATVASLFAEALAQMDGTSPVHPEQPSLKH